MSNKKNRFRPAARILCLALTCVMLSGLVAGCGNTRLPTPDRPTNIVLEGSPTAASDTDELVKISENDAFILYANLHDGTAAVEDKTQGKTWYTNPEDRRQDGLASGFNKDALLSAITVVYTTDQSVEMTCGAYMNCVSKDGLSYYLLADGSVVFIFNFPKEQFYIPVRYAIAEDHFSASILTNYIYEYGTNTVKTVDLLPFFGAGSSQDDGFLFVPDGSGALINFNNNRLTANTYSKPVYGFDSGTTDKVFGGKASSAYFTVSENQYMPVFGVSCNEDGFLAVISQGAPRASIKANVAYKYTLYNTVWSVYNYRTIGTVRQTQKDGSDLAVSITEKNLELWSDYEVCYYFLEQGKNGIADMAQTYRNYLIGNGGLECRVTESEQIPLYLDLYGFLEKTKSILGIPADIKIAMTTVEDVNGILDSLEGSGITDVVVKYNFWAKDSFYGKIPIYAKVDRKVGSAAEMQKLQQRLLNNGGRLYLSADLLNVYKTGRGVSQYDDVLQSVANTAQRQYKFCLDSAMTDTRYDAWYLLRPSAMSEFLGKFVTNMTAGGYTDLSFDSVGQMLYSELSSNGTGRNQVMEILKQSIASAKDSTSGILLTGANDYVASYATHLLDTASKSSGYDLEDASVPFYQMVYHGYISYSLGASNLSSNPGNHTLTCMEFGAYPMFSLTAENTDELIGSRLDNLYSADAGNWLGFIAEQYRQINEVLSGVQTSTIVSYDILKEDVRKVTYSNGTEIYVNYAQSDVTVDGIRIPAKGYAAVVGGNLIACDVAAGDR
ncbi:MAG: DUF5696 domain-containing protein [Faecousia sp.]